MLIYEILSYTASRLPDKVALTEGGQRLTYQQVLEQVEALANHFHYKAGISKGDRIALLLPNCVEFCIAYLAVTRMGAIVVPLNNRLSPSELTYILNDSTPEVMIIGYQFWETYKEFKESLKKSPHIIYAGERAKEGVSYFDDLTKGGAAHQLNSIDLAPDDDACIMYTSGTTGKPKGAVMSHRNIFVNARNCGAHLNYRQRDTVLIPVPLFHVTGTNSQFIAMFYVGGSVVIMREYNTKALIEHLVKYKITTMLTVPTMYQLMLVNPALEGADFSNLRSFGYGGAPMDPETIRSVESRFNVDLYNCYGLTETSSLTTVMPACDTSRKPSSVGIAVSEVQLRVVDPSGDDVPLNTVGELLVKGPNVVGRYWNKPEATANAMVDGWLYTGDFASFDDEGYVYIADRKKDMIIRGGENIYSIEVEAALLAHPRVLEAAVVPRPHTIFGEVVHAFVVPAPGYSVEDITEEEIIVHCQKHIADYKVPASVSFIEQLPRNPAGKIMKNTLRENVPPGDPPRR